MVIRELSAGPFSLGLLGNNLETRGALGVELRVMPCQMMMKPEGPLNHKRSRGKMAKGSPKVAKVIANNKKKKTNNIDDRCVIYMYEAHGILCSTSPRIDCGFC